MEKDELLKKAQNELKTVDFIIDGYTLTILYVGDKCSKLTGWSEEKFVGEKAHKFFKKGLKHVEENVFYKDLTKGENTRTNKYTTKDGKVIKLKVHTKVIKHDDKPYIIGEVLHKL